jgi:hypothetical protein
MSITPSARLSSGRSEITGAYLNGMMMDIKATASICTMNT